MLNMSATESGTIKRLPKRSEVAEADTWDLTYLFPNDDAWEESLKEAEGLIPGYEPFAGKLGDGPEVLLACLQHDTKLERMSDKLANYAYLKTTEDQTNSQYQRMIGKFQFFATKAAEASSYIRPELLGLPDEKLQSYLNDSTLQLYRLQLERLIRYKPHTLSAREEQMLAMQGEMAQAANNAFRQLLDSDMKFGTLENENGETIELSNSNFIQFLHSSDRSVRENAFRQYYAQFEGHKNTLTATLSGSIQRDIYYSRVRGYSSALSAALFPDNVPADVYENLVTSIRDGLPAVHKYYDLRRRKMGLPDIHHYDTYVPILSELKTHYSWDAAVDVVLESLTPLGDQYCSVLTDGLRGRWCDRYPNEGKQSGAFSYGTFDGLPYIMMNYKEDVLSDVFTLTHEAGHSMHSWHSSNHQPYEYHNYTIFVAEVASTFNEQLLARHLLANTDDPAMKAFLINQQIDDIRGTIVRQTMFAEFEKLTHELAEAGEPLTVDKFGEVYQELLDAYFGPDFVIDPELKLECLRIPHFYRAFYVYKYATGLSAAIALSEKVLNGDASDLNDYLGFLKGGCSKDPLDLLADAGVDMRSPQPVQAAMNRLGELVDQLEGLLPDK